MSIGNITDSFRKESALLRQSTEPAHLQPRCNGAPFAQERETYLLHLQQRGHSSRRLAEFNKILLATTEKSICKINTISLIDIYHYQCINKSQHGKALKTQLCSNS